MKRIFILLAIALCFSACEKTENNVDRIYPQGFSATKLSFSVKGGDAIITSQRDEWSLCDAIIINGEYFYFYRCKEILTGYWGTDLKPGVCSDSFFTVKYDILKTYIEIVEIEGSWFKITKENPRQIAVFIDPNLTEEKRQIRFDIGDKSGTSISITQLGK